MLTLVLPVSSVWYALSACSGTLQAQVNGLGELVSIPYNSSWSDREAVYQVLNAVLAETRLPTVDGAWIGISLYNPLSKQVACGPVPDTVVYTENSPLYLPSTGLVGEIVDGKLVVDGNVLSMLLPGVGSTQKALASHLA